MQDTLSLFAGKNKRVSFTRNEDQKGWSNNYDLFK